MTFKEVISKNDIDIIEEAKKCETIEQLRVFSKRKNIIVTDSELFEAFDAINSLKSNKKQLDINELNAVAGGKTTNQTTIENSNNENNYNFPS